MKGTFVRYDESTGTVFIKANAEAEAEVEADAEAEADFDSRASFIRDARELARQIKKAPGSQLLSELEDENYYLIVPEEHRRQMSIKPGAEVDFDLVGNGSKEVARMRF
ncbi:hypothetical protein [Pseudomonas fluorescens]|uniref:Uncharacterized protein n=1 Tax=Pseudomonas fluorescens TaxID=294 RepID=A0A5E6R1Y6_PSEFL|nr:hypothetical protein [Pseudomonas fluorescens]VVM59214.1 hypothetical protein PS655_01204 [Pseudomonas fluorescens]